MFDLLFTAGSFGYAAISGVDAFVDRTIRYAVAAALKPKMANEEDAKRIVELAKSRVGRDSGNLAASIHYYKTEDGFFVVTADATKDTFDTYYARFHELGTRAGTRDRIRKSLMKPTLTGIDRVNADGPASSTRGKRRGGSTARIRGRTHTPSC